MIAYLNSQSAISESTLKVKIIQDSEWVLGFIEKIDVFDLLKPYSDGESLPFHDICRCSTAAVLKKLIVAFGYRAPYVFSSNDCNGNNFIHFIIRNQQIDNDALDGLLVELSGVVENLCYKKNKAGYTPIDFAINSNIFYKLPCFYDFVGKVTKDEKMQPYFYDEIPNWLDRLAKNPCLGNLLANLVLNNSNRLLMSKFDNVKKIIFACAETMHAPLLWRLFHGSTNVIDGMNDEETYEILQQFLVGNATNIDYLASYLMTQQERGLKLIFNDINRLVNEINLSTLPKTLALWFLLSSMIVRDFYQRFDERLIKKFFQFIAACNQNEKKLAVVFINEFTKNKQFHACLSRITGIRTFLPNELSHLLNSHGTGDLLGEKIIVKQPGGIVDNEAQSIQLRKVIGYGGFGKVYQGLWKKNGECHRVALKCVTKYEDKSLAEQEVLNEVRLWQTLAHNNVIQFLFLADSIDGPPYIAMELAVRGSLREYLVDLTNSVTWSLRFRIAHGLACGLEYIHQQNIIHFDIKSENIVLDEQLQPKICDFGLAERVAEIPSSRLALRGTTRWMAPEFFTTLFSISQKVDVWSLAMVFLELVTHDYPFSNLSESAEVVDFLKNDGKPSLPKSCLEHHALFSQVTQSCWETNPHARPTASYVKEVIRSVY